PSATCGTVSGTPEVQNQERSIGQRRRGCEALDDAADVADSLRLRCAWRELKERIKILKLLRVVLSFCMHVGKYQISLRESRFSEKRFMCDFFRFVQAIHSAERNRQKEIPLRTVRTDFQARPDNSLALLGFSPIREQQAVSELRHGEAAVAE